MLGSFLLLACAGVVSLVCVLLVFTQPYHAHLTLDSTFGVQKFHEAPTPRIGGVAIFIGLALAVLLVPRSVRALLLPMVVAAIPAFVSGLSEDMTKRVSGRTRLMATMASGILAWWLIDVSLTRLDVAGADWLMRFVPLSVLFTAFAVAGVANSFNIIDGFNGLAGGVALIALAALGAIGWQAGDHQIVQLCIVLGAVTAGFLLVNFPLGKIFLGDGGAYLLGFLVAWIAVMLPMRNPSISPWASLLACGYPILETAFSVARKMERRGCHPCQPDRVHLHMLLYSRVSRRLYPNAAKVLQNSLTSPFAWAFAMLPASIAVLWPTDTATLLVGLTVSAIVYRAIYLRLTQFRWCFVPLTRRAARPAASHWEGYLAAELGEASTSHDAAALGAAGGTRHRAGRRARPQVLPGGEPVRARHPGSRRESE